jgi:peptidoglycan LD-endopeptidase CwlK
MPNFSLPSLEKLSTCHPDLQRLFKEVIKHFDCTIICGHRGEAEQEKAFLEGKSKARFGKSKHNTTPSMAVDVAPYPIDWQDIRRFYLFAGYVLAIAQQMGIKVRWGGDWSGDLDVKDNNFNDLPHWEIL